MQITDNRASSSKALTSASSLMNELLSQLEKLPVFEECAYLDYPEHYNVGDHLLWIAGVIYIKEMRGAGIGYTSSLHDFSCQEMKRSTRGPVIFAGGGSFGDLWPEHQLFRERVIEVCHDRPIIVLPQTIYFQDEQNLARAAAIFNAHPDVTFFVRDQDSYNLAVQAFSKCKILKAPDMVFLLADLELPAYDTMHPHKLLFLSRDDAELDLDFQLDRSSLPQLTEQNWFAFEEIYSMKHEFGRAPLSLWQVPGAARLYRELWQRRFSNPALWRSRRSWKASHPYSALISSTDDRTQRSWLFVHDAICQLQPYPLVITNRLHGHILSVLLRKPNIFLPNSYNKNRRFYREWTHAVPFCRFVDDGNRVPGALHDLREGV